MIHFITLFVFISHVFSQTTTDPVQVDCTGKCNDQVHALYVCQDSTSDPWVCTYDPSSSVSGTTANPCVWKNIGCPTVIPPACDCGAPPPTAVSELCSDGTYSNVATCVTSTDSTGSTTCKWSVSTCPPVKTGYCPKVALLAPTDPTYAKVCPTAASGIASAPTCKSDSDCASDEKCCTNTCNQLSCQTITNDIVRPGTCPKVTDGGLSSCDMLCTSDGTCSDGQKCCSNGCGMVCTDVSSTITTCSASDCGQVPYTFCPIICSVAADGTPTMSSLVCAPASADTSSTDGTTTTTKNCVWTPKPCPDAPPTTNPGTCPAIDKTFVANCDKTTVSSTCKSDADCKTETKCCFNGCTSSCVTPIPPDVCAVTGVQDSICLDKTTADATASGSVAVDTSVSTSDFCYYACVQKYACCYDTYSSLCTRGDDFDTCVINCKTPPSSPPPPPPCCHKTSCDCLGDTANKCGWCQVKGYVTDKVTGTTSPYVWGYCTPSDSTGSNTCSAPTSTGGSGGDFCAYAPSECIDNSAVDPSIKDTSSQFIDPTCKEAFSKINSGDLTEVDLQIKVDATFDITIKRILKANAADNKGTVSAIVVVNSNANGKSLDDFCNGVTAAFSKALGVPLSNFKNCQFLPYSDTDTTGTTAKRAQLQQSGGATYLHGAIVDPSTTPGSSAGTLAPLWMMVLFAIFLFFRV